jgi:hypothetical protein
MASSEQDMLVFLISLFTVICMVFAVLGYGAINDGQRLLFTGISLFALVWVAILGLMLAFSKNEPEKVAEGQEIPIVKVSPVPPKAPSSVGSAVLPAMAYKGMSFHLEPAESSPIFRIPAARKRMFRCMAARCRVIRVDC